MRKPSRRIYQAALDELGAPGDRCVLVDDLQHNLDGAWRLGIDGVLHRSAAGTAAELRDRFGIATAVVR